MHRKIGASRGFDEEMMKIERKVRVSAAPTGKYPWGQLGVGDSFLMVGKTQQWANSNAIGAGKRLGWRFETRKVKGGVLVWRVA